MGLDSQMLVLTVLDWSGSRRLSVKGVDSVRLEQEMCED